MMRDEHMVLKRMVVLVLLAITICLGFAAKRRFWDAPLTEFKHLDKDRVAHMKTLLAAIKQVPKDAPSPFPSSSSIACGDDQKITNDISELNRRLEKLQEGESPFLFHRYQLDANGWLTAAFQEKGGCSQAAASLGELLWLDRSKSIENTLLVRLDWQERRRQHLNEPKGAVSFDPRAYATFNPWRSLPGCVLFPDRKAEKGPAYFVVSGGGMGWLVAGAGLPGLQEEKHCLVLNATSRSVPRDLSLLVGDLAPWRDPESSTYRKIIQDKNKTELPGGKTKEVGLHAVFTIDPELQAKAQTIAECYAGEKAACKDAEIPSPGDELYENARVRRVGIAVIDIATGEIEALASAESACFRHDVSGSGPRPAGCPDLGEALRISMRSDTDALRNHALFTAAPPASTSKPIVAAGLLADKAFLHDVGLKNLREAIRHSSTESFLSWMFCGKKSIPGECDRPRNALAAAHALGWNLGCDEKGGGETCGFIDVLFGRPAFLTPVGYEKTIEEGEFQVASRPLLLGRLLIDDVDGSLRDMTEAELFPAAYLDNLRACAKANWKMDAIKNKAGLGVVSEGRGQGSSRATPLGVATMMGNLAASAQGKNMPYPHLVRDLLHADGTPDTHGHPLRDYWRLPEHGGGIDKDRAKMVSEAMTLPHRPGGTANKGCKKVFGECGEDIGLASKTGTPGFAETTIGKYNAAWKTYAKQQECYMAYRAQQHRLKKGEKLFSGEPLLKPVSIPSRPPTPWKWYAGFYSSSVNGVNDGKDKAGQYDKAFAVLVERNWHAQTQVIDDPGDVNSSAVEIGFSLLRAVRQDVQP